jgi:hypothetical protein
MTTKTEGQAIIDALLTVPHGVSIIATLKEGSMGSGATTLRSVSGLIAAIAEYQIDTADIATVLKLWGEEQKQLTGSFPTRGEYWQQAHQRHLCKHEYFMRIIRPELASLGVMLDRGQPRKPKK